MRTTWLLLGALGFATGCGGPAEQSNRASAMMTTPPPASGGSAGSSSGGSAGSGGAGGGSAGAASAGSGGGASLDAGGGGAAPAAWGPEHCPSSAPSDGYTVGSTLGPLELRDCDTGAPTSLDALCGAAATWIFAAHTHCPTCKATADFTPSVASQVAAKNVAIAHVVHDDNGTSCAAWRASFELDGIDNVRVYADPTGAVWSKLQTQGSTAPSAFLDRDRVIVQQAHGLGEAGVLAGIDAALAD